MNDKPHAPDQAAKDEAKRNPGGWVYKIDGHFPSGTDVPAKNIIGAWRVNDQGKIIGEFIPNPNYSPEPK